MGSMAASRAAPRAGGKPRPYYTRLGVPFVYSRGDPCGRPGGGARPISTILNLTPIGHHESEDFFPLA